MTNHKLYPFTISPTERIIDTNECGFFSDDCEISSGYETGEDHYCLYIAATKQ